MIHNQDKKKSYKIFKKKNSEIFNVINEYVINCIIFFDLFEVNITFNFFYYFK